MNPKVSFSEDTVFEGNLGDFQPDIPAGSVQIEGRPNQPSPSLSQALGLDEAEGFNPVRDDAYERFKSKNGISDGSEDDPAALKAKLAEREAELRQMRSKEGQYGREVVGPLRAENQKLQERLQALEARINQPQQPPAQQGPVPAEELVPHLFGRNADATDPELLRIADAASKVLYASERGTATYIDRLEQRLASLEGSIVGRTELAAAGLNDEQVRQAEEKFPELRDLPEAQRFKLIARLMRANGDAPRRDSSGRFAPRANTMRANDVVEGSGGTFDSPAASGDDFQSKLERFREIGRNPKLGGGRAQQAIFLEMLRRGELN